MQKFQRSFELAKFFYVQRVRGFDAPERPHFDEATLEFFHKQIAAASLYVEFGCGGSTVAAAEAGVPTISVESDRFYAAAVRKRLPANADITLIDARVGVTREWGTPLIRRPTERVVTRWQRYIELPLAAVRERGVQPDFVLVDGRFRRACALAVAGMLAAFEDQERLTTLLFDDYEGRPHYHSIEDQLGEPERVGRAAVFRLTPQVCGRIDSGVQRELSVDWR